MSQTPDMEFSGPWAIHEGTKGFQLEDATGFPLLYVPFEDDAILAIAHKRMNKKQAKEMATKITMLMNDLDMFRSAIDKAIAAPKMSQPIRLADRSQTRASL
jgi:hypothetical protein